MTFFLPTSASLIEEIDKRITIHTQDGRIILGVLRSYDHFANLVLENVVEQLFDHDKYAEIQMYGGVILRGENIVLIGQVDASREALRTFKKVSLSELLGMSEQDAREYSPAQAATCMKRMKKLRDKFALQ